MSPRFLLIILLAFALPAAKPDGHAQELNYTHFTTESGLLLPSNEVYGIVFDKNNVLWATTGRGVWRYDGYDPRQFTVADGLKENTNFRIFVDSLGKIMVSSVNNYLYQIIWDTVRMHPAGRRTHETENSSGFIQRVVEQPDSSLYLCYNRPGLWRFKSREKPIKLTEHRIGHEGASLAIHYTPDNFYWDMIGYPSNLAAKGKTMETVVTVDNGWIYLTCSVTDPSNNFRKDLCPIGEHEFIMSYANRLFHIKDGALKNELTFDKDIYSLHVDRKGGIWVGFPDDGLFRYSNGDITSLPNHYMKGESVTGIAQDYEGNYWFTTTNNGIFLANTLDITVFKFAISDGKDNMITAMTSDGENIYLGTQTGKLFKGAEIQNQDYRFQPMNLPEIAGPIRKLAFTDDKHLVIMQKNLVEIDTLGRYCGIREINDYPYEYVRKPNGEWLASFPREILVLSGSRILRRWNQETIRAAYAGDSLLVAAINRVRSMHSETDGTLWMGSQKSGLFSSSGQEVYRWSKRDTLFGKNITDIVQAGANIWVSVADYGLAVIRPDSTFIRITQKDRMSSDIIDVLFAENDSVVWAGTNNGLNRITLSEAADQPIQIKFYTMREGLPSNRIYQIIKHKNQIWIATTQGAIRLDPDFTKPLEFPPKLVTGPLIVNGVERQLADTVNLRADEVNLIFKFKAITYRQPSKTLYRYKLVGVDKDYVIKSDLEARYPELNYGTYTFLINATYSGDFNPATEKTFIIRIARHWYESMVAWVVIGLFFTLLLFVTIKMIVEAVQAREQEKRRLLQAEKKSLLSQMNPHFIFNSLNSIQHFIVQNDDFQANNYLTNFSGLIRRILENSKKNLIPLQEEISTLNLYLSMEKLRFENEFEYQIIKDHHIDYNETMIPPMLIQPFVENAIWHGLMPMKSKGSLLISFQIKGDYIRCRIEDNGIGREQAQKIKRMREHHVSNGIQNVEERIDLLNRTNKKNIKLTITDLKRSSGASSGTVVEIELPIDLKY